MLKRVQHDMVGSHKGLLQNNKSLNPERMPLKFDYMLFIKMKFILSILFVACFVSLVHAEKTKEISKISIENNQLTNSSKDTMYLKPGFYIPVQLDFQSDYEDAPLVESIKNNFKQQIEEEPFYLEVTQNQEILFYDLLDKATYALTGRETTFDYNGNPVKLRVETRERFVWEETTSVLTSHLTFEFIERTSPDIQSRIEAQKDRRNAAVAFQKVLQHRVENPQPVGNDVLFETPVSHTLITLPETVKLEAIHKRFSPQLGKSVEQFSISGSDDFDNLDLVILDHASADSSLNDANDPLDKLFDLSKEPLMKTENIAVQQHGANNYSLYYHHIFGANRLIASSVNIDKKALLLKLDMLLHINQQTDAPDIDTYFSTPEQTAPNYLRQGQLQEIEAKLDSSFHPEFFLTDQSKALFSFNQSRQLQFKSDGLEQDIVIKFKRLIKKEDRPEDAQKMKWRNASHPVFTFWKEVGDYAVEMELGGFYSGYALNEAKAIINEIVEMDYQHPDIPQRLASQFAKFEEIEPVTVQQNGEEIPYYVVRDEDYKKGLFDQDFNLVIPLEYTFISPFRDQYFEVTKNTEEGVVRGLVELDATEVLPEIYDRISGIENQPDLLLLSKDIGEHYKKEYGLYNLKQGQFVLPVQYNAIYKAGDSHLYYVRKKNPQTNQLMYGLFDMEKTDFLLDIQYDEIKVSKGKTRAFLKKNKRYRLYDIESEELLSDDLLDIREVSDDVFRIETEKGWQMTDINGDPLHKGYFKSTWPHYKHQLLYAKTDSQTGYIDYKGNWVTPSNTSPLYAPSGKAGYIVVKKGEQFGMIDKTGKQHIPYEYEMLYQYMDGVIPAKKNGGFGLISIDNQALVPFEYENITLGSNGTVWAKKDSLWGQIDYHNKTLQPFEYSSLSKYFETDYHKDRNQKVRVRLVKKDGKFGIIKDNGDVLIPFDYPKAKPDFGPVLIDEHSNTLEYPYDFFDKK